ncbi:transmembrane protein 272-like [Pecten maximus]|uniref:transmembrane protein 272-like n=1 Tax=Pecten maximus TaxID=6579 RepID=UPI001457EE74|nr:transmembrane protein 272-like [Pecten maximus]XP_033746205.1 transmembrane protein 272-like [Pecten maximus]XP_033746206.1 transmembrane protein 272-like [Pecten maximus]XP_033746207.1 transmembrane protein 272-like [Pecten maximus]XP_033746208.1 transmembrane protein 272-like [Pecten maximus]XP_033746209.1 transmembrane protein 272-like [Pecten maximus]XP_033746211.1 transmembrane protein 272-like [Pecten maximus]XP_033746212.1 transmembrane protein 272-like [Pecten maximus]XP_03374621
MSDPPSYDDSAASYQMSSGTEKAPPPVTSRDVEMNAPPPAYDSLFGKLKEANEKSEGKVDFAKTAMGIVCGSVVFIICVGLSLALPIAEIAIGASYLHDCPAERLIPIYLIVAGVFGTLKGIGLIGQSVKSRKNNTEGPEDEKKQPTNPFDSLVNLFLFAWFICGNVWVYGLKDEWVSSPATAGNYCHPTLYYFSFWVITTTYIMMGVGCLVACIMIGVFCCVVGKNSE